MEIPWYIAIIYLIIAIGFSWIYGTWQESNGWKAAKKDFYGRLPKKESLLVGMHYWVFAVIIPNIDNRTSPPLAILIFNGKRYPEDNYSGKFVIEILLEDISDNNSEPLVKSGDTIVKTTEGKIVIVPT